MAVNVFAAESELTANVMSVCVGGGGERGAFRQSLCIDMSMFVYIYRGRIFLFYCYPRFVLRLKGTYQ